MNKKFLDANLKVHVDDTSIFALSKDSNEILDVLVPAELAFAKVAQLKLSLSPKGAVVSSREQLTSQIWKELRQFGVKLVAAKHTRDLGVTFTAGRKRPNKIVCKTQK